MLAVGARPATRAGTWLSRRVPGNAGLGRRRFASLLSALPQKIIDAEYAERGASLVSAREVEARRAFGRPALPLDRQVLACLAEPSLIRQDLLLEDARSRASRYLEAVNGDVSGGSGGRHFFRSEVAASLARRDGLETPTGEVFLVDGMASAAGMVLRLTLREASDCVLLPYPHPPAFGDAAEALGGQLFGYFVEEGSESWDVQADELAAAVAESREVGATPRVLVVASPGNPTGQVMPRAVMESVLEFCAREQLLLLADETQQDSVFDDGAEWLSFRRLASELDRRVQICSLHAVSQWDSTGCGMEGVILHCHQVGREGLEHLQQIATANSGGSLLAQALVASALTPPEAADREAVEAWEQERGEVREGLRRRASLVSERLNAMEGVKCHSIQAGAFAYPRVIIKGYVMKKAISFATPADQIYCLELAERYGVGLMPGSGFGQRPGHFHFCLGLAATDESKLEEDLKRIAQFHAEHPGGWFS